MTTRRGATWTKRIRWWMPASVALAGMILGSGVAAPGGTPAARAAPARTIVSITFDDGTADQRLALPALRANDVKATFYVPSGYVGSPGYLTREDLHAMSAAGHEIGGHTVNHADLAALDPAEAMRQICVDRRTLSSWGFEVRSFAYPFGSSSEAAEKAARDCGYRSARLLGDLASPIGCEGCPYAEDFSPPRPHATRALPQFDRTWTLADLQQGVLNAETTGGWVQFTFHTVCQFGCGDLAVTPRLLSEFLAWVKPRAQTHDTVVQTVGEVIGGEALPVVDAPRAVAAGPGENGVANPGMESVQEDGTPVCWMRGGWGENSSVFLPTTRTRAGTGASRILLRSHSSGDAKLLPQFDLGACSPEVVPGRTYSLRSWYTSDSPTQFVVYLRNEAGAWLYWTSSPWFPPAGLYVQAEWTTQPIPAGYTGISFGLSIFDEGNLRTDDVAIFDSSGAPPAGPATISAPPMDPVPAPGGTIEVFTEMETSPG